MPNPKYKITNFTKDNVHWLKGMLPVSLGGSQVLTSGYYSYSFIDKDTTGYSSLSSLEDSATAISDFQLGASTYRTMALRESEKIFLAQQGSQLLGLIHTVPNYTQMSCSSYQDILVTTNNNILYPNNRYLGVGYYFKATDGGSGYLEVTGTDFTALGVANTTGHNKIYNLTTGTELTVTSVSGSGNIRLNFTGTGAANNLFLVFVDDKFELTTDYINTEIQFKGQESPTYWRRQIVKLDDRYFILNGNYIAMLSADETTITDDYQQFPLGVQSMCFSVNNDLMLIGAKNKSKDGMLLVYDGFSTYFKSIIYTDSIPLSIIPYQGGWIVLLTNGELRYTDGVSYRSLAKFPDSEVRSISLTTYYNGMVLYDNKVFISSNTGSNGGISLRQQSGIHIYDIEKDMWSFCDTLDYYGYNVYSPYCLYTADMDNGGQNIYYGKDSMIGRLTTGGASIVKEIFLDITLPSKQSIKKIELNLGYNHNRYYSTSGTSSSITVSSGDGRYGLYNINQIGDASTTTNLVVNSTKGTAFVGQELMILGNEYDDSVNSNSFTYITAINNNGESNESWTVSPALASDTGSATQAVRQYGFIFGETKTITYATINKDTTFNIKDHYGDKLYLHIRMTGYLDLRGLNIY